MARTSHRALRSLLPLAAACAACVPPGNSTPTDSGPPSSSAAAATPTFRPSLNVMTAPFVDTFDRTSSTGPAVLDGSALTTPQTPKETGALLGADAAAATKDAGDAKAPEASLALGPAPGEAGVTDVDPLGPDWLVTDPARRAWRIENGKLCGQGARNHGVWLKRVLPVNARIEFDAIAMSDEGDIKAEVWGDGASAATSTSYTNATSYLAIFGGWKNQFHVLARINEHGNDRKELKIDPSSDDPRQKPVVKGQPYHVKVERTDGRTVKYYVDDLEYLTYADPQPLTGAGHDHFGFNEWSVKVCFDNVKITPL